jgi:hypothetical protein
MSKILAQREVRNISLLRSGESILNGSDDGVVLFEESCFRTLSIVQCFSLKMFRKLALLPSSGKREEGVAPTLWGPLERTSLNHWTWKQSQLPKRCF